MMNIKRIGVIGAGLMGNGIAHASLLAGYEVTLIDAFEAALPKAVATMTKNMDRQAAKGTITAQAQADALARLTTSTDYAALSQSDVIIEAAPEREELKKSLYTALTPHLAPHTILASNTSSISITRLAAMTDRPGRFIGMHFFNPVPMMKLVEIIRGIATDDATYATILALAETLGKTVATAQDSPGFIVNRILCPMINEAIFTLAEGIGDVLSIDAGMKLGANHPMGPLELADYVGLDTLLSVMRVLHAGLGEDTAPARFWSNMSRRAGWAAKPAAASTTIPPPRPARCDNTGNLPRRRSTP
jgi:3-hydroxybutyryl-CoA dehydrogenase